MNEIYDRNRAPYVTCAISDTLNMQLHMCSVYGQSRTRLQNILMLSIRRYMADMHMAIRYQHKYTYSCLDKFILLRSHDR